MILPIQFKIKENPYYLRYLRSHSNWYKLLNRNPGLFKSFEDEVRREYRLTGADRVKNAIDTLDVLSKILSSFK